MFVVLCWTSLSMITCRSITLLQMALFHSFWWLSNIPLYMHTTFFFFKSFFFFLIFPLYSKGVRLSLYVYITITFFPPLKGWFWTLLVRNQNSLLYLGCLSSILFPVVNYSFIASSFWGSLPVQHVSSIHKDASGQVKIWARVGGASWEALTFKGSLSRTKQWRHLGQCYFIPTHAYQGSSSLQRYCGYYCWSSQPPFQVEDAMPRF